MRNHLLLLLAVCFLLCFASPALAADSSSPVPVLFGGFYDEFVSYWKEKIKKQNAMVIGVLIVGAIGIMIIMTSKKGKK